MHTPDHMKVGDLRKELRDIRKEYYKPLGKMGRKELMAEHERHSGLMVGKSAMVEPMPSSNLEAKIKDAHVNIKKHKVIPGLPQAMGVAVGSELAEGGKRLGEPATTRKKGKVESEGVAVPNVTRKSRKAPDAPAPAPAASAAPAAAAKAKNPYNAFMAKHRKEGKTMKEIGELWKKTKA